MVERAIRLSSAWRLKVPKPCSVCVRDDRGVIDQRLSFQVVNVAALARELGLSRDALVRHRASHLPAFLPAFRASADALTLGQLQAEAARLYSVGLDALARAEAALLQDVASGKSKGQARSLSSVARFVRESRQNLGLLAKLSSDAAGSDERPAGVSNGVLDAGIAQALERVMARSTTSGRKNEVGDGDDVPTHAELVETTGENDPSVLEMAAPSMPPGPGDPVDHPGTHVGQDGEPTPPLQLSQFSDTPKSSSDSSTSGRELDPPNVSLEPLEAVNLNGGLTVKHPDWHGSPAASTEERAAEGYADIPIQQATEPSDAMLAEHVRLEIERARHQRASNDELAEDR